MFHGEMTLEVERRLQQACDDRARAGLPPPVSFDALRAMVRNDLLAEIEAKRVAPMPVAAKTPTGTTRPAPIAAPKPSTTPVPKLSAMELIARHTEGIDLREPAFSTRRGAVGAPGPKPIVDQDEAAAQAILAAGKLARGRQN